MNKTLTDEQIDDFARPYRLLPNPGDYFDYHGFARALLAAQQPKPQCTCDMRTKVLGDGCAICQPEPRAEVTDDDKVCAERYRCLRRGQRWSVINGIGDTLRADELDAAIDAARGHGWDKNPWVWVVEFRTGRCLETTPPRNSPRR
ncbi:hypothetical protein LGN19_06035 [Burkholderia sp. AU30198]|uniref:hypothetical protein n=1 Tax=Burkholderia sp. AU30198 TaxID=2879627 RepID=UPI001CF419DA|nr:hypothetical protein [Burkholderia sp. AU30198]MCA8293351.1 hypothetical protein [Burkholderia sp. AU30198]